jgi:transposase
MLARMGAMFELKTRPPHSEALLELKELHLAREALVKDRTAAKNRGKVLAAPLLERHNAQRLEQIKRQITVIEAAILERFRPIPTSPNGSQF